MIGVEIENKTATKITSKERIDTRLWDAIALREAVINAIIHNDYTREVPPKFEIFADRLEITSYGGLFEGMTQGDFFDGLSLPRNKELMRVYKDLEMVEQLGSGVPRILQAYSKECFKFSENFVRMVFPSSDVMSDQVNGLDEIGDYEKAGGQVGGQAGGQAGGQVGGQVDSLTVKQKEVFNLIIENPYISRSKLSEKLNINSSAVQKHIEALKKKGYIDRESETTGYWNILIKD